MSKLNILKYNLDVQTFQVLQPEETSMDSFATMLKYSDKGL